MSEPKLAGSTVLSGPRQLAVAVALALIVFVLLLGDDPAKRTLATGEIRPRDVVWLAVGLVLAIWLLALTPSLTRRLAGILAPRLMTFTRTPSVAQDSVAVARWLVALSYVLLVQAGLRRPFVAILGTVHRPSLVEATFAAVALLLMVLALLLLYRAARPFVEVAARSALDVLIATSGSEAPAAVSAPTRAGRTAPAQEAATRPASTPAGDEVTLPARTVPIGGPEPTLPTPKRDGERLPADRGASPGVSFGTEGHDQSGKAARHE